MKISRTGFYVCYFTVALFYIAGFVYASMFAYSYENDVNVDFVVFTIEHCLAVSLVIVILPIMYGLFIVGLENPYLTFQQEDDIFALLWLVVFFIL